MLPSCQITQEAAEALYLIPGVDMLNHSTDPECRNTSLALTRGKVRPALPVISMVSALLCLSLSQDSLACAQDHAHSITCSADLQMTAAINVCSCCGCCFGWDYLLSSMFSLSYTQTHTHTLAHAHAHIHTHPPYTHIRLRWRCLAGAHVLSQTFSA